MKIIHKLTMLILMLVFMTSIVSAISFREETVKQDLTSFEWCFLNPYETDKDFYNENLELYVDNVANSCKDVTQRLVVREPVTYSEDVCSYSPDCNTEKVYDSKNDSYSDVVTCKDPIKTCKSVTKTIIEEYDLTKTDYLLSPDAKICLVGNRKAKTGFSSCDMNFIYDDGIEKLDVADYGKAWWNISYNVKIKIDALKVSYAPYYPFSITFNSSYIDDCGRLGDIRVVNSTEDGVVVYNITYNAGNNFTLYINESLRVNNFSGYVYCNATTPQNTTSVNLPELELSGKLITYHNLNDNNFLSFNSIYNLTNAGTTNSTGKVQSGRNYVGNQEMIYADSAAILPATGTLNVWYNVDDVTSDHWIFGKWGDGTNALGLYVDGASTDKIQLLMNGGGSNLKSAQTIATGVWTMLTVGWNATDTTIYMNSLFNNSASFTLGLQGSSLLNLGRNPDGDASHFDGNLDEPGLFNLLTPRQITALYGDSYGTSYPFYAIPSATLGDVTLSVQLTNLVSGLMDDYVEVNDVDEGEEFRFWANYTYENGTKITGNDAWCNFTGNNISREYKNQTVGTNWSVCSSVSCDSNPSYIDTFASLPTIGYSFDLYKFKLCRMGNLGTQATIRNNCTLTQTLTNAEIPLCSVGYANYSIKNTCAGDLKINITFTGAYANRLVMVDKYTYVDRFGNWSGNMTWNATEQLFISQSEYEHYAHGSKVAYFSCYNNLTSTENNTNTLTYSVNNTEPLAYLDTIADYFNGEIAFTGGSLSGNAQIVKYPLVSDIMIDGRCVDDDLNTSGGSWLSLYNSSGSLLGSVSSLSSPGISVNYTVGNFTPNALYYANLTCGDNEFRTNKIRWFNTSNLYPVVYFMNTSGQSFSYQPTIGYYCYDADWTTDVGSNIRTWIYVNGTLMTSNGMMVSNATVTYSTALFGEGFWSADVICYDSLFNSSNATFTWTYSPSCILSVGTLSDGTRYQDNSAQFTLSCTNNVSITDCYTQINDFEIKSYANCSDVNNISLELGWNRVNITVTGGGFNSSQSFNVWAKKYDSDSFADYAVIVFTMIITAVLFFVAGSIRSTVFFFMAGVGGLVIGYELLAFSMVSGLFVVFCSAVFSLAVMFRKSNDV